MTRNIGFILVEGVEIYRHDCIRDVFKTLKHLQMTSRKLSSAFNFS